MEVKSNVLENSIGKENSLKTFGRTYLCFSVLLLSSLIALGSSNLITNTWWKSGFSMLLVVLIYLLVSQFVSKKIYKDVYPFFKFRLLINLIILTGACIVLHLIALLMLDIEFKINTANGALGVISYILSAFFIAMYEEILFRYTLLATFLEKRSIILQLLFSSVLFGLIHVWNPKPSVEIYVLYAAAMGIVLGLVFWIYKNIWYCIFLHFAVNLYDNAFLKDHNGELTSNVSPVFHEEFMVPLVFLAVLMLLNLKPIRAFFQKPESSLE